jgi:hypothetical protein
MLKRLALVSLIFSSALAQSQVSHWTNSAFGKISLDSQNNLTDGTLIPAGISDGCAQFLNDLNNNGAISACVSALLSATSQFAPGGNAGKASSASITDALAGIESTNLCPESLFQGKLAEFYSQCPTELTSGNTNVIEIYDVLYVVIPLKEAICSKDDSDNYCLLQQTNSNSPSGLSNAISDQNPSDMQTVLNNLANNPSVQRRASTAAITPNATTFRDCNLPFLFLQPSLPATQLCVTCTRQIFNSYYNFETAVPYAPGLPQSPLLGGQMALYSAIQNKCGPNFLQSNVEAAGDISGGSLFSSAAPSTNSPDSFASIFLGLMTLAISLAI